MNTNNTTRINDVDTITREMIAQIDARAIDAYVDNEIALYASMNAQRAIDAIMRDEHDAIATIDAHVRNVATTTRTTTTNVATIDHDDCVTITRSLTKSQRAILRREFAKHAIDTHAHRSSWINARIPRAIAIVAQIVND